MSEYLKIEKHTFEDITRCGICFCIAGPKCTMCSEGHVFCSDCIDASLSRTRKKLCPTCRCLLDENSKIRPRTYELLVARIREKCEFCSGHYEDNHQCSHILRLGENTKLRVLHFLKHTDLIQFGQAKKQILAQITVLLACNLPTMYHRGQLLRIDRDINCMRKHIEYQVVFNYLYMLQTRLTYALCISGSFAYYVYSLKSSKYLDDAHINNLKCWAPNDIDIYLHPVDDIEEFIKILHEIFPYVLIISYPENEAFNILQKKIKSVEELNLLIEKSYADDLQIKRITEAYIGIPPLSKRSIIKLLLTEPEKHRRAINHLIQKEDISFADLIGEKYPRNQNKIFKIQFIEHAHMKRTYFNTLKHNGKHSFFPHRNQINSLKRIWKNYDIQDLKVGIVNPMIFPPNTQDIVLDNEELQHANVLRGTLEFVAPSISQKDAKRIFKYCVQRRYLLYRNPKCY